MDAYGRSLANGDGLPNEDAFLIGRRNGRATWAGLADGAGRAGGLAARLLRQIDRELEPDAPSSSLGQLLRRLDAELEGGPQSTLTLLMGRGPTAIFAWAGDSRILSRSPEGRLELLTPPLPRLGSGGLDPGMGIRPAPAGSTFLLLSDGAWSGLGFSGLQLALGRPCGHPSDLPSLVLEVASRRGRPDDLTCVTVFF